MSHVFAAAACFAERIRINTITSEIRDGRRVWIKRRRPCARCILVVANRFFRLAGNPVQALIDLPAWQRWEVESFRLLHAPHCDAFAEGARVVVADELPGVSLSRHLREATLTVAMVRAAARELRRGHALRCATFKGPWSHGDPHAGNFLYDAAADRARLIDFEVQHDARLSPRERHADDLLVFLQDVVGRVADEEWLPLATAFLETYDEPEVVARLAARLVLPRGIPRLWWAVRTTYLAEGELARRLELLREALTPEGVPA
jgi:hypothetical protein